MKKLTHGLMHIILIVYSFIVIYPLFIMVSTSFKTQLEVFKNPFGFPSQLSFESFNNVWKGGKFLIYYKNSFLITLAALLLILIVSILASYALGRFQFKFNKLIYFYFLLGIMIPIRLGVIQLCNLYTDMGLFDTRLALIFTYTAMGIPFTIFIVTGFIKEIPVELEEAAKIDGCSSMKTLTSIFLPLLRPAIATAAIYHFIPIWNDVYFPLIFIRNESYKTVPLGVSLFFGQHQSDLPTVFSALTTAALPVIIFYLLMSKNFIKGLTAGAVKG